MFSKFLGENFRFLRALQLQFVRATPTRYVFSMNYKALNLDDYDEGEDLMDMDVDIEAVRETKVPFAVRRFVIERYYYCSRCSEMHSFTRCATAPVH